MRYKQLKSPNLNTKDSPGWCLRHAGNSFDIKPRPYAYATLAWQGAKHKHTDALPDAAVPVWFTWEGTIDGVYKNWGDVAIWVPGKGVFGTPLRGGGNSNRIDATPEARAKAIGGNARYLGWSEDLNGVRLVEPLPEPQPTAASRPAMPPKDSSIQLVGPVERTTFRAGTTNVAGKLKVGRGDSRYVYVVRGYDAKYPGRILINSASAGGNGVALALYYTNGNRIEGWKQL